MTKINEQKKIFWEGDLFKKYSFFIVIKICFDLFYFRFRMIDEMRPPSPPGVPHYSDGEVYHVQCTCHRGGGDQILSEFSNFINHF